MPDKHKVMLVLNESVAPKIMFHCKDLHQKYSSATLYSFKINMTFEMYVSIQEKIVKFTAV